LGFNPYGSLLGKRNASEMFGEMEEIDGIRKEIPFRTRDDSVDSNES
jgi:hypothetical protein